MPFELTDLLAVASGALVGLILAVIGGGGSILATPLLLYVVGINSPHAAIGTGALAVSLNAFLNLIPHARAGNVKWPCAATFAASGIAGAAIGAQIGKATDAALLLPLFAGVMLVVAVVMAIPRKVEGDPSVALTPAMAPRLIGAGLIVGLASGFFGIGGGFLVVPGLMASTGMGMLNAVGSSLFSVGAFGATTAVSYAADGLIDWRVAALFVGGGVLGGLAGTRIAGALAKRRGVLQRAFAVVLVIVAVYMLYRSFSIQ
jgi:uncharacterized membrane protein YfcA